MSTKKSSKKLSAGAFLCITLAVISIIVATVCVVASKRNKELISGNVTDNTTGNADASVVSTEHTTAAITAPEKTSDTTAASAVAKTTAKAPVKTTQEASYDASKWYLTMVNRTYSVPSDYEPELSYVCGTDEQLEKRVAVQYEKMFEAGIADGVTLTPCSGYRSYSLQERNFNNSVNYYIGQGYTKAEATEKTSTIILPPGFSEHHLGYAMDIVCVDEWFEDTAEFEWLNEHAADYGFILRYPADKQDITKIIYEPWHWRYVGVETAKKMKASGQVLEEYLGLGA